MALTPIIELGVGEAHAILTDRVGFSDLPPLAALENEDWGRDFVLAMLHDLGPKALADLGLTLDDDPDWQPPLPLD